MTSSDRSGVLLAILMTVLGAATAAQAAELKAFCANGMRAAMEDLVPAFERASGHTLAVTYGNVGTLARRLREGETADVIVLPQQGIDAVVKEGTASAAGVAVVARSGIGVAVRKGAPKPDISTPDALRRSLLAAASITYLDPTGGGLSGAHFVRVLERLGIADAVNGKTVLHANAAMGGALVANGTAELGVNVIQELLPIAGIEVVGPLPEPLQSTIVYAAAPMAGANVAAAKALVEFLVTPQAASVIRARGMDPAGTLRP